MLRSNNKYAGVLQNLKASLAHSRLGDLLVLKGKISQAQLQAGLTLQKQSKLPLGQILREQGALTRFDLFSTLGQQFATRSLATCAAAIITVSSFSVPKAHASSATLKDAPVASKFLSKRVSLNRALPGSIKRDKLFGTRETRSSDISAFTKWTTVASRLNGAELPSKLRGLSGASDMQKIEAVNNYVNGFRYIEDKNNWRKSDYWATPAEFYARGGDCEDFAIAKYAALKALGISPNNMRLAIVQDQIKNIPHAVLVVYTSKGSVLLDNQMKSVKMTNAVSHYKPIYSINKQAWWRHLS